MKNYALYKKTVDILYDAYFNDTLEHYDCCACAVGNLVSANMGPHYWESRPYPGEKGWAQVFCTSFGQQFFEIDNYNGVAKEQIDATGYTPRELAKIEKAFENVLGEDEEKMYNGLVAVLEVLKEIHEIKEDNEVERFTNHYRQRQLA